MVTEEHHAGAVVHRSVFADKMLVEDRGHGRDVLVTEAQIGARESGVAGLYCRNPDLAVGRDHVSREDLLGHSHGTRFRVNRRNAYFALQTRDVEWDQSAVLDHLARDFILSAGKDFERNLLAAANAIDEAEVG